jgi:hypothetical protein
MAAFDYQEEVAERIRESGAMPDIEASFEILANHRIREAMAAGDFDNLPGKVHEVLSLYRRFGNNITSEVFHLYLNEIIGFRDSRSI